ncbi:MAG: hypothetical protein Q8O30_04320 [Candidatus Omnitrophota bacterium]|nr:hypothetical protein [Candidatus Omnitrophota bacterium]
MKGYCGIDIDSDKVFISLAKVKKSEAILLKELDVGISPHAKGLVEFLKEKGEAINKKIKENEIALSMHADTVYLNLPLGLENKILVEAHIPLRKSKKITATDILYAKRYLENTFLNWDDICIHHLVLNYEVEGNVYKNPPFGVIAKRIKMKSLLVVVKDRLRKDIEDIFYNLERNFGGFIFPGLSILSTAFGELNKESFLAAFAIGYDRTHIVIYRDGNIDFNSEHRFGLKNILEELARKLILPLSLAQEVYNRYISLKETPPLKEVSIKNGETYINLSINTVNSFVKDYIKQELNIIIEDIKPKLSGEATIAFIGRLNPKEGLGDFLKGHIPYSIIPLKSENISSSFGCIRYGVSKFLERDYHSDNSIVGRIMNVYKEYF